MLVVAAPVYQPDGSVSADTTVLAGTAPHVVHVAGRRSICDVAVAGAAEPREVAFGWRVTSQTLSATSSAVVVSIDWQRLWDRGQKIANGPSGTVQLTLHPGDRIPLDLIPNSAATDACRAVGAGLEVRLARSPAPGRPVDSTLIPLGAAAGGAGSLDADLWLVHRLPSGGEQTHHQTVRLTVEGGSFSFSPVTIATARGDLAVDVSGGFRRYRAPAGTEFLYLTMSRTIGGAPLPPGGVTGGTATTIPLPGPAEVLSLELPGPGAGGGGGGARGRGGRGTFGGVTAAAGGARQSGGGQAQAGAGGGATTASSGSGGSASGDAEPRRASVGTRARWGWWCARGGGVASPDSAAASVARLIQTAGWLDGHVFSLRVRFTPVQ